MPLSKNFYQSLRMIGTFSCTFAPLIAVQQPFSMGQDMWQRICSVSIRMFGNPTFR
jgi:hypothetical protein